jgi:hypothetical protein
MQADHQGSGAGSAPGFGQSLGQPAWAALVPAAIVAGGGAEQPVERLMTVQSAIARAVHLAMNLGQIRLRLPHHPSLRYRFR